MCGGPPKKVDQSTRAKQSGRRKTAPQGKEKPPASSILPESSKSNASTRNVFSSPSQMKTTELTHIYEVPSSEYETIEQVIHENGFELGAEIGKGSYATVFQARRTDDNQPLACKVLLVSNASKSALLAAKNELFILERVNHPHIIRLYKHFIVETGRQRLVYIFMQLADDSLSTYMRNVKTGLPEATCKRMFAQMVCAVNHMHQKRIAHRDLKMGNVLIDKKGNLIVTDFGLSRVVYRPSKGGMVMSECSKYCGTVPYMAPEILLAKDYKVEYDPFAADIWALGVLLFCIVNRGYPFGEDKKMIEQQMRHKIKMSKRKQFDSDEHLPGLFSALLDPKVDKRIKIGQLMVHPWIRKEVRLIEDARAAEQIDKKESSIAS